MRRGGSSRVYTSRDGPLHAWHLSRRPNLAFAPKHPPRKWLAPPQNLFGAKPRSGNDVGDLADVWSEAQV